MDHAPGGPLPPEYNETRRKAGSFLTLAKTPELACEVTLQPLARFALDAAIIFSDILTVPDAMGLGLYFAEGEGPRFERPLREERDIQALAEPDLAKLRYVFDAIALTRKELHGRVPLIGFSGSPFTLACYMIEGGGSDDFRLVKSMMYARPDLLHQILATNAAAVAAYLNAQVSAGAQALMIFDTWGGSLAHDSFAAFSLAYSRRVIASLTRTNGGRRVPVILFSKGGGQWLVPWRMRARMRWASIGRRTLARRDASRRSRGAAGNLDPMALFAPPTVIEGSRACWRPLDAVRGTSSTSATVSHSTRRRSTCKRW